jgi:Mg2+/citrate symporter
MKIIVIVGVILVVVVIWWIACEFEKRLNDIDEHIQELTNKIDHIWDKEES